MTISSGFFNSVNHDRLYDAEQFGSIFDGVINDGVYEHVGEAFAVSPNSSVNDSVIIGTGRAWFNHTWIVNDSQYSVTLNPPNLVLPRYDALVFDIDRRDSVRKNSITIVEGTPNSSPQYPEMLNEELHKQYPFAYVMLKPGESKIISVENITYNVGNATCPLVTGPLEVINDDNFFQQMNAKFETFKNDLDEEFTTWFEGIKELIEDLNIGNINLVNSVDNVTIEWPSDTRKLQVKDRGITRNKLSYDLQTIIGVFDPTGWSFQDYYDYTNSLSSSTDEEKFTSQYLTSTNIADWTSEQIISYYGILKSNTSKETLWKSAPLESYSILDFRDILQTFGSGKYSSSIGKKFKVDLGDTYGIHNFILIGINADTLASGGNAFMTFQSEDVVTAQKFVFTDTTYSTPYSQSPLGKFVSGLITSFPQEIQAEIKEVTKYEHKGRNDGGSSRTTANLKMWIISVDGMYELNPAMNALDTIYDYYSAKNLHLNATSKENYTTKVLSGSAKKYSSEYYPYVLRDSEQSSQPGSNGTSYAGINKNGYMSYTDGAVRPRTYFDFIEGSPGATPNQPNVMGNTAGIVPCFCI